MQTLLLTAVREVDKQRVFEADTVLFNDGSEIGRSRGLEMQAGDFYFRPTLVTETLEIRDRVERFWRWLFRRAADCLPSRVWVALRDSSRNLGESVNNRPFMRLLGLTSCGIVQCGEPHP